MKAVLGVLAIVVPLLVVLEWLAADIVDHQYRVEATNTSGGVRSCCVAPGDDAFVYMWATGRKGSIRSTKGNVVEVTGTKKREWPIAEVDGDNRVVTLPSDVTPGAEIHIKLALAGNEEVPGPYGWADSSFDDTLDLPIEVMASPAGAKVKRIGLATLALVLAGGLLYLLCRWKYGPVSALSRPAGHMTRSDEKLMGAVTMAVVIGVLALGHVVFVRPILTTTPNGAFALTALLATLWALALVIGAMAGARIRREAMRWNPGRLRAIEGSNSKLPAVLSRPATAASRAAVTEALGGSLEVKRGDDVIIRVEPIKAEPWLPEDLKIVVRDRTDGSVVAQALVGLYGPLEYLAPWGAQSIVEA